MNDFIAHILVVDDDDGIRYLVKNESFERYPSDPSDSRNWGTIKNKKIVQ